MLKNNKNNNLSVYVADFENDLKGNIIYYYIENLTKNKKNNSGNNINNFFDFVFNVSKNEKIVIYFHNLNYDGMHILLYLLKNNFKYNNNTSLKNNNFNTFVTESNAIFNIKIRYNNNYIKIFDSAKIIKNSVEDLAKNTKYKKINIDFNNIDYEKLKKRCINDVKIVKEYLKTIIKKYGVVSTASKIALNNFIENNPNYKTHQKFLTPHLLKNEYDFLRCAYSGGLCYLSPRYFNKKLNNIKIYDVNSMYPYIMSEKNLPIGRPIYFEGQYEQDPIHPLYIQHIKSDFCIKRDKIPFLRDQRQYFNIFNYGVLHHSNYEVIDLYLTNEELSLFIENYNIYHIKYINGYKFMTSNNLFKDYIKKYYLKKCKAKNDIEKSEYKIILNSLYGKFATKLEYRKKTPYFDKKLNKLMFKSDGVVKSDGLYLPIAIFITSLARVKLINDIQNNYNNFVYCDTDSIALIDNKDIKLDIDNKKLGYYKKEYNGDKLQAIYLKEKCYLLKHKNKYIPVVSGATEHAKKQMTFENFKYGYKYENLKAKRTEEGIILEKSDFEIL